MLEELFFNDSIISRELEERLFIGSSTLNRLVHSVKAALKKHNIALLTNPFKIQGNEQFVRSFFTIYFKEAYHFTDWPFKSISREVIDTVIPLVISSFGLNECSVDYHQLCIRLAVDLTRSQNGYTLSERHLLKQSKTQKQNFFNFKTTLNSSLKHFDISATDINHITSQIENWALYFSRIHLKNIMEQNTQLKELEEAVTHMLTELPDLFNLPQTDHTTLIFELVTLLDYYKSYTNYSNPRLYILFKPRDYFLINIYKEQYELFYKIAKYRIENLSQMSNSQLSDENISYLLYILFTKWENLTRNLFSNYSSCRLLLFSRISQRNAENIKHELLSHIKQAAEINLYDGQIISEDYLEAYDFDLLLTTTMLDLNIEQPIHYLHRPHLTLELERVNQAIDENIQKNKEKTYNTKLKKAKELAENLELSKS